MATTKLPRDFREFLELLNENEVEYLLVGDFAVCFHGHPCYDGDLDIWVSRDPENAEKLAKVLRDFGVSRANARSQIFLEKSKVIQVGNLPVRIDILTDVSGLDFVTCYANCVADELEGIVVHFINIEDLKTNKRASGRAKDLSDLEMLA